MRQIRWRNSFWPLASSYFLLCIPVPGDPSTNVTCCRAFQQKTQLSGEQASHIRRSIKAGLSVYDYSMSHIGCLCSNLDHGKMQRQHGASGRPRGRDCDGTSASGRCVCVTVSSHHWCNGCCQRGPATDKSLAPSQKLQVKPPPTDAKEAENISGSACALLEQGSASCLLIGDEKRYTRFYTHKNGKLAPGDQLFLLPKDYKDAGSDREFGESPTPMGPTFLSVLTA